MKTLLLIRHAKSDWSGNHSRDFDRTLNARGLNDAPQMANLINQKINKIDKIFASPAIRAFTTAKIFAQIWNISQNKIITNLDFYENGLKAIPKFLSNISNEYEKVAVFGHNPDITLLVNHFTGEDFGNLPTCCVSRIDFDIASWEEISKSNGKLIFIESPKTTIY